ncbi:MAG: hypothetical protein PHW27_04170 [Melioribacteraceae bacterium]|nr:hypothetical protein [Melioribacteraceae bacterium]MDD3557748.1 hypothetical protein [Melioribacteraceae bacterium]
MLLNKFLLIISAFYRAFNINPSNITYVLTNYHLLFLPKNLSISLTFAQN